MVLSDNETKVDLLNNEAIAKTIEKLLRDQPQQPVTIGVHGDWGAGKSSVLEMLEDGLSQQADVVCIKFNGWRFQGFEDSKIALIEVIVSELIENRPVLTKASAVVQNLFARINWLKVAKSGGQIALASQGVVFPDQLEALIKAVKETGADPEASISAIKEYLEPAETKNIPAEISEFRKAFDSLLKEAGISQLIVLVDDLDRCLPDTAIETLEAIRLFVFTSNTAFVIAADEAMIEYAVRKHFPDLPESTGSQSYARNYLEKLIQVPFRIPPLGELETQVYVALLMVGSEIGQENEGFSKLIAEARNRLQRPWQSTSIDSKTLRDSLGEQSSQAQHALTLADQISPSLAKGSKGNPRQIKRFLNTLILRQRTADARGFGGDIHLPILAKLMLAEAFLPRFFDQIASIAAMSADGMCSELKRLENRGDEEIKPPRKNRNNKKPKNDAPLAQQNVRNEVGSDQGLFGEWELNGDLKKWAVIEPRLSEVDLRPYLFVTKDKRDYFGAVTTLGHLDSVVEQLFGKKLLVQQLEPDLKKITVAEAQQVFNAVRSRILNNSDFLQEPDGMAGIAVLVRAQPELQETLVDFLEGLPIQNLGAWVLVGWDTSLKSSRVKSRFNSLVKRWAESDSSSFLKTAAQSNLKIIQAGR